MLKINKNVDGDRVTLILEGEINTDTSRQFAAELDPIKANEIILDFEKVEYISSAGLRVLIRKQDEVDTEQAHMTIRNINDIVEEVFDTTGFMDILTIE